MREVVLYELVSLDGVAEEPSDWMSDVDDALVANLADVISRQDDVLLGRATYDYWADYWPTSDVQPFADFINNTAKHVFTSTGPDGRWPNTTFVDEPAAGYVRRLRTRPGRDIGIHGSISLAGSLLEAGLVDRMELVVAPALATTGRRLFDLSLSPRRCELLASASSPSGALFLRYGLPGERS
jgi:dihydrofolate reductase